VLAIGGALWVGSREGVIPLSLFVAAGGWWIDLLLGLAAGGSLICVWRLLRRYLGSARELEAMIEAIDHRSQVGGTAPNVLLRVERVVDAHEPRGVRHELHQPHGASPRYGARIVARLNLDDGPHEAGIEIEVGEDA